MTKKRKRYKYQVLKKGAGNEWQDIPYSKLMKRFRPARTRAHFSPISGSFRLIDIRRTLQTGSILYTVHHAYRMTPQSAAKTQRR